MAVPFQNSGAPALRPGASALERRPLVNHDPRDFQLVDSADGFFRLLWQTAGGNPRVSLYLWLQSLHLNFGSIRAKLFRQPDIDDVDE